MNSPRDRNREGRIVTGIFGFFIARPQILNERLLWAIGGLVAALLVGAFLLSMVERWRKRQLSDEVVNLDPLSDFRRMYERGELSKEEYENIRAKLARRYYDRPDRGRSDEGADSTAPIRLTEEDEA